MYTKKHTKTSKKPKVVGRKNTSTKSSKIYQKALFKKANGDLFYKENGKLVPFTGDIEEWLGVEES